MSRAWFEHMIIELGVWMWNKGPGIFFPAGAFNNQAGPVFMLGSAFIFIFLTVAVFSAILVFHK